MMDGVHDPTPLEAAYRSIHPMLWRALLAYTGDRDVASDAESEAFAQVIRCGDEVVDVAAWVWRSAFAIAGRMLAGQAKVRPVRAVTPEPSELGGSLTELISMLDALSDQPRACIVLRYLTQLDNAGIAAALGTREGTVRVQLRRAHATLRGTLEEAGHVDEREAWLLRRFDVLEDAELPDLWEQIVVRADTEPNVDVLRPRGRSWVPIAAAAAAVLVVVLVGVGFVVWTGDDPTQVDAPPGPAGGDNTVEIIEHDDAQAIVTSTAVAGIVSFDISNPTDGYRGVEIRPMVPGARMEEVRAAAVEFARTGAADTGDLLGDAVLGVASGPHDHFVTAMPLDAGEYAVFLTTSDATFEPTPDADGHEVRQLTITAGNAGAAPAPSLTYDRMADDYVIGPTTATRGTATIRVDNTVGGPFQLALIELRPDATKNDLDLWELGNAEGGPADWSTAPVATVRVFYAGAPLQTVTVDLGGGDLKVDARPSFEAGGLFSFVWVSVQ